MLGLIATLLGVVLATSGVFLFFSNRRAGLSGRGYRGELAALALLVGGGAILLSSVALWPDSPTGPVTAAFDANRITEQQPTASGMPAEDKTAVPRLPYKRIAILSWGTPSDTDSADQSEVAGYSAALQQLVSQTIRSQNPDAIIEPVNLTREDYQGLLASSLGASDWCARTKADLLVAVGVGASRVGDQYTLWREPLYAVMDCHDQRGLRQNARINERPGDRFPYQMALGEDIAKLLQDFARQN
jgi:hypothetical protein